MRKTLSLVLALAMAISLVTFQTAGAQGAFTDSASIQYPEAVDVITALEIMGGYNDGTFKPTDGLTRGAATKIICNLILTPAIADAMPRTGQDFKDVAAGSTFAGYIHYCVDHGIVGGYGNGLFGPQNGLTGFAFLKMLLGALGYDQDLERYSGSGWQINVQNQALSIGLTNGLIGTFDGNAQVTRQVATQMALNALQADEVEYSGTTAGSRRVKTSTSASSNNISSAQSGGSNVLQLAEDKFPRLVKRGGVEDAFGHPATGWTLAGRDVGTYQARPSVTYYNSDPTIGTIYNDLGMSVSSSDVALWANGVKLEDVSVTISRNATSRLSAASSVLSAALGNASEIEVFRDDDNAVTICVKTWWAGKIASVQAANSSRERSVTISGASGEGKAPAGLASNNRFETNDFAAEDVVAYTFSGKASGGGVQEVRSLTKVQGSLDRYVTGTSLELAGQSYPYAKKVAFGGSLTGESGLSSGTSYVAYVLNLSGQQILMWIENAAATVDGYALVTAVTAGDSFSDPRARLLFANGTVEVVYLSRAFEDVNAIVRYAVNNSGKYVLTKVSDAERAESTSGFNISNRVATGLGTYSGGNISADNATIFVVRQGDHYQVYTGVRNVPNVSGDNAKAYTYHDSGTAKIVFVTDGTTTTTSRDLTFIAADSASSVIHDSTSANGYRTFRAVVGGKITELKIESGISLDGDLAGDDEDYAAENSLLLDNVSSNTDGIVVSGSYTSTTTTIGKGTGVGAPTSGGLIDLGGQRLSLSDSVKVWYTDKDGRITASSRSGISADEDDVVLYTVYDGEVTNLFILEV